MRNLKRSFWAILAILVVLWLIAEPSVFQSATFFALRGAMVQLSGILAIGCMSVAMILALRPRWPESWLGGLDKMYRLHKWLGITALVVAVVHWLWANGPKWAVGWGLLERPTRGARPPIENPIAAFFADLRGSAESLGEWAFYAAVVLIVLALIQYFPYRLFYKTHRLLALAYLVLVFHAVVLIRFSYWTSPLGWVMAVLLASGTWASVVVLLRRVGASRQVKGRIVLLQYYPGVRALESKIEVPHGWPGHKPGQFAFATSDASEGAHPYTIASNWHAENPGITFITKELGDHTSRLRKTLRAGQEVTLEGPYGCFTFDDDCPHQIWIGGGIGITPFVARMKHMAMQKEAPDWPEAQMVDLFHSTADVDEEALGKLAADARSADVRLHVLIDARDGHLTGERVRRAVPQWREASIWFCGPAGFGEALKRDFAAHDFPVKWRFHQEFFAMR
ncbi:ferredoxin reductase family protein [Bradyrhizobium cajani]|uniref:Ferric reductase n=1 Tax=Bradyrhizobium cajani TaxID=1928661 RepID=A0A844T3U2_9BRAD|nr:ferric reductase-like transmembrane domain-containing protein [Bradyrhizobium cajani]MCP3371939.1 ferric reductase-like transmembrane domain-containing protein [Bradyrhizobium cajani]MVT72275.1 ferric reductase [Bradyrhizobium cajani]